MWKDKNKQGRERQGKERSRLKVKEQEMSKIKKGEMRSKVVRRGVCNADLLKEDLIVILENVFWGDGMKFFKESSFFFF